MAWRDNLLPASFRGAKFSVSGVTTEGGRRNIFHTFINRDKPLLEDLGGENDTFVIEAFIIQSTENSFDYFADRDNLIKQLKRPGFGLLVHPFYGTKKVGLVGRFRISETFAEGGVARFSLTFTEIQEKLLPKKLNNFLDKIDNAMNKAFDKVGDVFNKVYTTTGAFMSVTESTIGASLNIMNTTLTGIQSLPTKVLNQVQKNITQIRNGISDLISFPKDMFNAVKDSANSIAIACGLGIKVSEEQGATYGTTDTEAGDQIINTRVVDSYNPSLNLPDELVGGEVGEYSGVGRGEIVKLDGLTVPDGLGKSVLRSVSDQLVNFNYDGYATVPEEQQINVAYIFMTLKFSMLANAVRIALRIEFFSQEEVIEYRELIMERFNDYLLELGDLAAEGTTSIGIGSGTTQLNVQDLYQSSQELMEIFSDGMTEKISETAKAIDYESPAGPSNCLTLAYDKYEDLDRMSEIYARNLSIDHPGFIPSKETLRILSQ